MKTDEVMEHQEEQEVIAEVTPNEVLEGMNLETDIKEQEEKLVPLSALQKERKKRQDAELQNEWHMQQQQLMMQQQAVKQPEEVDESDYENITKAEYKKSEQQTRKSVLRDMKEELWMESNPEKKAFIDQNLPQFLKQRPNLALAIDSASNRYKEAYELMDALTLKQKKQIEKPIKRNIAPNSPNSVPKSAVMNDNVDIMNMSDAEFVAWRKTKSKRR